MAKTGGLSKKHSPLQQAHYKAYRLENRAEKNLISRLKRRFRHNLALSSRRAAYNKRALSAQKKIGTKAKRVLAPIYPDIGAIKRLKQLGAAVPQ